MAILTTPANGTTHSHTQANANVFKWSNTSPTVPSGSKWRLKIGSGPFGYNYYFGTPVPFTQLEDRSVHLTLNNSTKCYATVEWSTNGGATWSNGGKYTSFYCKA